MKHVVIAIPAYTGQIHLATMRSIVHDMLALSDRGDRVTIHDECGHALIADCRAQIVADFLASDGTDLVFVDSDVSWEKGALLRLVDHPVDVVAGVYPVRRDPLHFTVQFDTSKPEVWSDANGLIEVHGVPAGFLRLTRACLEKMRDAYADTAFFCERAPNQTAWALFADYRLPSNPLFKMGEDYAFCARWRDIGGKVFLDPEMTFGHTGYKTFFGRLGTWLKDQHAVEELSKAVAALEKSFGDAA